MNICHDAIWGCSDDCAGVEFPSFWTCPGVKQSCECKWLTGLHQDPHRLFGFSDLLPLIETVSRDNAAFTHEQIFKGGLLQDSLRLRIDLVVCHFFILVPRREKNQLSWPLLLLPRSVIIAAITSLIRMVTDLQRR